MQITEDLIERFLADRCTAEEAAFVAAYLETHPGIARHYLQADWNVESHDKSIPPGYQEEMLKVILAETKMKKKFPLIGIRWMGIAASLLIVIGFVWLKQTNKPATTNQIASEVPVHPAPQEWKIIENNGNAPITEVIPDGSVVILSPKACLRYAASFTATRRDLYLNGEALFEVVKDKSRPFTVHEGMFSTTALGTVFRMKEHHGNYQVKLYEGKVVIKALESGIPGWKSDVFLEPGQQMEYNEKNAVAVVNGFGIEKMNTNKDRVKGIPTELEFMNRPLDQVLDQLAGKYKLSIEYNKEEIEHLYFSGKVLKTDSLETILKVIAQMNELKIVQKGNGFVVNKTQ